jgi:hypothetical protein
MLVDALFFFQLPKRDSRWVIGAYLVPKRPQFSIALLKGIQPFKMQSHGLFEIHFTVLDAMIEVGKQSYFIGDRPIGDGMTRLPSFLLAHCCEVV